RRTTSRFTSRPCPGSEPLSLEWLTQQFGCNPQHWSLAVAVSGESGQRHVFLGGAVIPGPHADIADVTLSRDLALQALPGGFDDRYVGCRVQNAAPHPGN